MVKIYTLEELAGLAGVARTRVKAWEAQGLLGEVRKNGHDQPAYGFEQAERCVELGGRGLARRVCVVNQKGGVGKTTTVFSLAAALADLGRRVLAADLDAQANLTSSFGFDPDLLKATSEDLLVRDEVGSADVILETGIEGVHAVPADIRLCNVETKIQDVFMREQILRTKLEPLFDRYHVILFDCPPNLSRITINALMASQEVLVPIEPQSYSIKAISDLTNTFALLKEKMRHDLRVWLLPTKVDRNVLRLELTYRLQPHVAAGPRYRIGGTGVHSPVDLVVTSAGQQHGRVASIVVNGTDASLNRWGYNVVVVDPRSGSVVQRDGFDTFRTRAESVRLADFIGRVPAGWLVVAAIREDGVGQLTDDAVLALRTLGGQVDPRGTLFVSHLVIGVKGAAPGTAVEAFGPGRLTRVIGRDREEMLLVTRDFRLE
jgi:chromosome partitioning protein